MALRFLNDGYFAGSVGIGTDSPSDKLDVQGAGGVGIRVSNSTNPGYYANLKLNYNDVSTMQLTCLGTSILQAGNTGNTVLASRTNKDIILSPNGTGKVGIGTESPATKLQVSGTDPVIRISDDGTSGLSSLQLLQQNTTTEGFDLIYNSGTGDTHFNNIYSTGSIKFHTAVGSLGNTSANTRMTILSGGNVGIGTDSPTSYYSGADNLVVKQASGEGGMSIITAADTTGAIYFGDGTTGDEQYRGGIAYTHSNDKLVLVSGGSNKLWINSTGNVGIGTDNPGAKTHIYSGASGQASAHANGDELILENNGIVGMTFLAPSANSAQILFGNPTSSARGIIMYDNSNDKMSFGTTTAVADMVIDTSGNVGIGTASPGTILDVSYGASASNTAQINLNGASGAAAELILRAGGDDNGTIYNRRAAIRYYSNQISTTTAQWVNGVSMTQTTGDDKFYFNNSGNSTVLCLQQNGRVGINTPTPTQELHVQGGMRLTGAFVDKNATAGSYYQVLSSTQTGTDWVDASSPTIIGGPYLPLAGGTMTGTGAIVMPDGFKLQLGNGIFSIFNDGTYSIIRSANEPLLIDSNGITFRGYSPYDTLATITSSGISIKAALLSNQENTDVDTGTETVANVAIATYTAAFFDFVIKKTTNVRSGTVYACHDGTSVVFTETSTNDLGDTSDVTLSVDISGGNMRLLATTTSDDWSVKSLIRAI